MKGRYRWLAALGCALVLSATGLAANPAQAETEDLGLLITWCNDAPLSNAAVEYTIWYSNNSSGTPVTSYTNSSGEVVRTLTLDCEVDRIVVRITPNGSSNHFIRDYKLVCHEDYNEWSEMDAGGGSPPGGSMCDDAYVGGSTIDWHIRVP